MTRMADMLEQRGFKPAFAAHNNRHCLGQLAGQGHIVMWLLSRQPVHLTALYGCQLRPLLGAQDTGEQLMRHCDTQYSNALKHLSHPPHAHDLSDLLSGGTSNNSMVLLQPQMFIAQRCAH